MKHAKTMADEESLARLEAAAEADLAGPVEVRAIMSSDVATCTPTDSLNRCAQLMWERRVGCVPVVDPEGRPVSIVTDRDVCMAAYIQGKPLAAIGVASAMSRRLFTIEASAQVGEAASRMRRAGVHRLLVVGDDGALVGVLSFGDLAARAELGPPADDHPFSPPAIAETAQALRHSTPPPPPISRAWRESR